MQTTRPRNGNQAFWISSGRNERPAPITFFLPTGHGCRIFLTTLSLTDQSDSGPAEGAAPVAPSTAPQLPKCIRVVADGIRWRVRPDLDSPALRKILDAPDEALAASPSQLAHSDLVTMAKLPPLAPGGPPLLMRRLNYGRFRHWLRDTFRPTRAERAFRFGWELELLGIPTAQVYATGVERILRYPVRAYLITEFITRATTLHELFEKQKTLTRLQLKNLAASLGHLHGAGYSQRDLKAFNILMVDQVNPWFIDLDGVQRFPASSEPTVVRDLARLSQEFLGQPREFQRLAPWFLKHYCQARGRRGDFRHLYRKVLSELEPRRKPQFTGRGAP